MIEPDPSFDAFGDLYAEFKDMLWDLREAHPQAHLYVLLDPFQGIDEDDPLELEALAMRAAPRPMAVVERPDLAHEPSLLPRLVQLYTAGEHGYVDEALIDLTFVSALERCRSVYGAYVAGWLLSPATPDALATHLATAGVLFDLRLGRERYLPLFEPHRIALLADVDQDALLLQRWLGPFEQWLFVDCGRRLRRLGPAGTAATTGKPRALVSRALSAAQDRLAQARLVAEALDDLGIGAFPQPERGIDLALARAEHNGLRDSEDIVLHALNDLTIGPQWSRHPTAAALIARVAANPKLGLAAEICALEGAERDEIARACASR